jgi:copper resistance protein C
MSVRRVISALAAAFSVLAVQAATAGTAAAHAELATSDPAPGSTVQKVPTSVRLTFTEAVAQPATVAVRGPDGSAVSSGDPDIADTAVTQALDDAGSGRYTVTYQVTSADGHPVEGVVGFSVTAASTTGPTTDAEPNSAGNAGTGTNAGADTGSAAGTSSTASANDDVSAGVVAGLVAGLALAIGLVVFGVRRLLRADG